MSNKNYVSKRFTAMLLMVVMILAMIPFPSSAATRWNLEGWRISQEKWIGGNLFEWMEDDYVPYRLIAKAYEVDDDFIKVQHDYIDADGHYGIDGATNWFIGPIVDTSTPIDEIEHYFDEGTDFIISGPVIVNESNSKVIEFTLETNDTFLAELANYSEWSLYWEAHLSRTGSSNLSFPDITIEYGSSYWNGASLHTHTSVTGRQDVPIQTPEMILELPSIQIEKYTNGQDADTPTGPMIKVGDPVNWTYVVTNTGNVALSNITIIDDKGVSVTAPKTSLEPGESMTATASGTATEGQYVNIGTAAGTPPNGPDVSDTDPSHYFGYNPQAPSITIEKLTNGQDADTPTGPMIKVGDPVNWTYVVTNTGNVALSNITIIDDKGVSVTAPKTSLEPGESMTATASGTATEGQYVNIGTAAGTPPNGPDVSDSDPSHYFGYVNEDPSILIDKTTNGTDGPDLVIGSTVTWSYLVTNTGNVALKNIEVTDDHEGLIGTIESLEPQASATLTKTGIAVEGNYTNTGSVKGWYDDSDEAFVTDSDQSNYTGIDPAEPGINITKTTNGSDGLRIRVGNTVTWEYAVKAINNFSVYGVEVTDSDSKVTPVYISGDDGDDVLEPGETWIFRATGTAIRGNYENTGYAVGWSGQEIEVKDQDDSSYEGYVPSTPTPDPDPGQITIFKFFDANDNGNFDSNELPMNNILFQLFDEDKDLLDTEATNDNGRLSFTNLDAGTYFIKEVRGDYTITTEGFDNDGFYEVDVDENETVTIEVGNYRESVVPEEPPLGPPPVIEEVIEDKVPQAPPVLPKTGELPPYFAYGFGSLLVLAGLFMKRKF